MQLDINPMKLFSYLTASNNFDFYNKLVKYIDEI